MAFPSDHLIDQLNRCRARRSAIFMFVTVQLRDDFRFNEKKETASLTTSPEYSYNSTSLHDFVLTTIEQTAAVYMYKNNYVTLSLPFTKLTAMDTASYFQS